ncbi:MAG: sialidase family protein [Actinomycetota bacterium]
MRAGRLWMVLALVVSSAALLAPPVTAAPAWGPQRTVDTWAWAAGSSFARTADGDLVALVTTDFAQGTFATDHGPFMGVFARTSSDRGATWSTSVRVSQVNRHADRAALAVAGGTTYAAWVTQQSYDNYDPSKPRVVFFRANPGGGWGKTVALTRKKGRVDSPSIAASGSRVYIAWVDANTGQVRVARSGDGGQTFVRSVIGKTSALSPDNEGLRGSASIGAAGNAVGVSWIASGSGAVKTRVSTNGGKKWHDSVSVVGSLGAANGGTPSLRGWGDKLALAWTTPAGAFSRVWSKSWGPTRTIASFGSGGTYKGGFDIEIVPSQSGQLGAVWSACRTGCDLLSDRTRVDVLWSDSGDGGGAWSTPSVVQGSVHADQQINESPTAAWLDGGTRIVGYTGRSPGWTSYAMLLRVGS